MKKVTCFSADGASKERRALALAVREVFPNVLIVIRDPAHAIRIASKSLHSDALFGEVWDELFDKQHALAPDLMNSDKWHSLLVAIQEDNAVHMEAPGQAQPMARVIRNLAFAKQRFDSTASPVAKIALMFLPVATLLAYIASDRRHEKEQRDRAESLLKKLDSKFCTATGVSADWGIICAWFLRLFDVANHDIAQSRAQIDCMIETLDAVFLEGRVFKTVLAAAPGARRTSVIEEHEPLPQIRTDQGDEIGFITCKVMRDMRHKYVFRAGGMPVLLWGEPHSDYMQELLERVQNIASLTKERLRADFPRNDLRSALAIFDRRTVVRGYGPEPRASVRSTVLHGVRCLATLLGCEEAAAVLQYNSVLPWMLEQMAPGQPLAEVSNQVAWASLLCDETWQQACRRGTLAASGALRKLIRFYISIEDGECTVERDLSELRSLRRTHVCGGRDGGERFLDDKLLVRLNGPRTQAEFAAKDPMTKCDGLTPFSRECASLWRELRGARGGHANPAATKASAMKRKHKGFMKSTCRGVLAAARLAVAMKRRQGPQANVASGTGTAESPWWSEKMQKFQARSANNIPGVTRMRACLGSGFLPPPGISLAKKKGGEAPPAYTRPSQIAAFDVGTPEVPADSVAHTGPHRCQVAQVVVVSDLAVLHDEAKIAASEDLVQSLTYLVLRGLDVVTLNQWRRATGTGNFRGMQRLHHAEVRRQPPARSVSFAERLRVENPEVCRAFRRTAKMAGSEFEVVSDADSSVVHFQTLSEVTTWLCSQRRLRNIMGSKAIAVSGERMPA